MNSIQLHLLPWASAQASPVLALTLMPGWALLWADYVIANHGITRKPLLLP